MILLMTVCMMRESVAVALLVTDGSLDVIGDAWSLVVKVQKSKTDQVRAVHTILVAPSSLRASLHAPYSGTQFYDRLSLRHSRNFISPISRGASEWAGLSSNTPCHIVI